MVCYTKAAMKQAMEVQKVICKNSLLSWATKNSRKGRCCFVRNETYSTLQLKPGDHSTLDHPGIGMRAKSPELSRCCNRAF